jgi:hypothetical protein
MANEIRSELRRNPAANAVEVYNLILAKNPKQNRDSFTTGFYSIRKKMNVVANVKKQPSLVVSTPMLNIDQLQIAVEFIRQFGSVKAALNAIGVV